MKNPHAIINIIGNIFFWKQILGGGGGGGGELYGI